jgi:phosphohistidine phosphatase
MRRLILMRHAKSSWANPGQRDIDRPLNKRGLRSAALIGEWLAANGFRPDHALVSTARRTRETWDGVAAALATAPATTYVPGLFHAAPQTMLDVLRGAPDVPCVLMLGHQPGIGAFARALLAAPPDDAYFAQYPTAATAVIDFDAPDWPTTGRATGRLVAFEVPRALE